MYIIGKLQQASQALLQRAVSSWDFSEAQLRAYFTKNDSLKIKVFLLTLAAGVCCFIAGGLWFPGDPWYKAAGAVSFLIALCLWMLIEYGIKIPTDAEYDAWVYNKAWESFRKAWRKVDEEGLIEQNIEQVFTIHGFVLAGTKQAKKYRVKDLLWKTGKDKAKRYSINVYTFFVPM